MLTGKYFPLSSFLRVLCVRRGEWVAGGVSAWHKALALVYCCILGSLIYLRWRSGAWRKINLR